MMYDYLGMFLAGSTLLIGLIMAISPKVATKKEMREDETIIKKTRRSGIIISIAGVVAFGATVLRFIYWT